MSESGSAAPRVLETRLIKDERGRDSYVVVNTAESPLALLQGRGLITAIQFAAGEKLRRDFTIAALTPRMGVDYSMVIGGGRHDMVLTEVILAARQRFNRAMRAVGPELSDVLSDVCCFLKPLDDSERRRDWPRSSARVVLCLALDRLAVHYGMRRTCRKRMRSWKAPDPPSPRGVEEGGGRF